MRKILALSVMAMTLPTLTASAEVRTIEVTARYLERMALPPDAVLEIDLLDTSRAGAPAIQLSSQRLHIRGVPATVDLPYESSLIDQRLTYTVTAAIHSGDQVLFRLTTAIPVITRGGPDSVDIVMQIMASEEPPSGITGATWTAYEIGGRMLVAEDPPTMTIAGDGSIAIFGGCNRQIGSVKLEDGGFALASPLAGTMMLCPDNKMKLETDFLAAIADTARYERNGDQLSFVNEAGIATVRFRQTPE
ncbi:YbaY family lipoprotein [Pseudoruegeria sp. HB172150]|uniref:YbaY family lipoprotein n=1 Tax=Pseudoruegeria sp. HB172150 TaxID=2721164 RepID=UPI0015574FA3|nr:YbaY family lipoprotein [Pseudoruegeria sp. HB172150]